MFSKVPTIVSCCDVVPQRTNAVGMFAAYPDSSSDAMIRSRFSTPIKKIEVGGGKLEVGSVSSRKCPVETVNDAPRPRCVTEIPAYAGAAATDANRAKEFFTRALTEAKKADDVHTTGKLTAAISADLARVDAARTLDIASKLTDVIFRDQAYRDITILLSTSDYATAGDVAAKIGVHRSACKR